MSEGVPRAPARRLWERVERAMLHRGWNKSDLARESGLGRNTIDGLYKGRRPSVRTVKTLAELFGLDLDEAYELAGLGSAGEEPGTPVEEDRELDELLARLPPQRRADMEQWRQEEHERMRRLRDEAREEYQRSMRRISDAIRRELSTESRSDAD